MTTKNISLDLDTLIKPTTDYRKYRFITLSNGLRAVVISDLKPGEVPCNILSEDVPTSPSSVETLEEDSSTDGEEHSAGEGDDVEGEGQEETQKAAVALCVGVGSFSDPLECQGLAHYLEHMVFMGSEKFPGENDFDVYVSQRGGYTNAYTTAKRTVFYFNVRPNHLQESLDRFANFFVSPLLNKSSMDRELTAVHSEYEMGKTADANRLEGLVDSLSKEGSPYRIFSYGSRQSLYEVPKAKGIDIYDYLKKLRINMYSAHLMTVAVIAKDTLNNLETLVTKLFADVPCSGGKAPNFSAYELPFKTEAFHKLYKVNPIKDVSKLYITWSLPTYHTEYKSHSLEIFGYLLGHEGQGSIISLLRKEHLGTELCAGASPNDTHHSNEMTELITVEIKLTELGLKEYKKVIEIVYQYLNMLRVVGIPSEVCEEHKQLRENGFKFKSVPSPVDSVLKMAENMQFVDDLDWLLAAFRLPRSFSQKSFCDILELLRPQNANYCLSSKSFADECTQVEEFYGCQYTVEDISQETYEAWNVAIPVAELHLPAKNIFLPKSFEILPIEGHPTDLPVDLTESLPRYGSQYGCLYYKMDKHFRIPKTFVKVYLWSPESIASVKNQILHEIMVYSIVQNLADITYFATEASFHYSIFGEDFLGIECYGFSDTLFVLYETIIKYLHEFIITEKQFETYKVLFRQHYSSALHKPFALVKGIQNFLLTTHHPLSFTFLPILKKLTVEDLKAFHRHFLSRLRAAVYVHGNATEKDAKQYFLHLVDVLKFEPLSKVVKPQARVVPPGDRRLRVYNFNGEDVNTALLNHYQLGPVSIFQACVLELFCNVLGEPAFNFLRTQELLGYSVGLHASNSYGICSICVYALSQTDKFSLDHCFGKMEHFFKTMAKNILKELSPKAFADYVASAITARRIEDTDMSQEGQRNTKEIFREEYLFDRREREIAALQKITREDLESLLETILSEGKCKHVSIQVESRKCSNACSPKDSKDDWLMCLESCCPTNVENDNLCCWLDDISQCEQWELYPPHKVIA